MSSKDEVGDSTLLLFCLGLVVGVLLCGLGVYNLDSDRASLDQCASKLERDRYCVMIAVPSEYKLVLEVKDGL